MFVSLPIVNLTIKWSFAVESTLKSNEKVVLTEDSIPAIPNNTLGLFVKAFPNEMLVVPDVVVPAAKRVCWPALTFISTSLDTLRGQP